MIHVSGPAAEDVIRKRESLTDRYGCEIGAVGHVADRIYIRHRSLRAVIDGNAAVRRVEPDASPLKTQSVDIRITANGEEDLIGTQ